MNSKINVLVTGVGGCGVGEGIAKALLMLEDEYRLVAVNMHGDAPVLFRANARYVVPPAGTSNYLQAVQRVCEREQIRILIPGSEPELRVLSKNADVLRNWGVVLLANPADVVEIGDDKWLTHLFLRRHGFGTPKSAQVPLSDKFLNTVGFPLVVKPRVGYASQNVFVVDCRRELDVVLSYFSVKSIEPIVQEYVGDPKAEFTASVLIGRAGAVLASIAMRRSLLGGFSQRVEIERYDHICRRVEEIAVALRARGPVNVQFRWTENECQVFEINPRFSGTTPFRALVGFNEVDILIKNFLFGAVPGPFQFQTGVVGIRGLEEIIVSRELYDSLTTDWLGGVDPT